MLGDIVDEGLLARAVADGYISARSEDGLIVYNYTASAQYSGMWNEATLVCRGLIADADGRVISRPFGKFFNHDEPQVPMVPLGAPMIVTEKWDGSLGILYTALDGTRRISTRGSTRSDQAQEGTRIWREKYEGLDFGPGVTPLFE
ncbi:MAG: 2'-5' RNA ligase, partial [bacterium]|nr:2'-5' RNA ligase [bacterium]